MWVGLCCVKTQNLFGLSPSDCWYLMCLMTIVSCFMFITRSKCFNTVWWWVVSRVMMQDSWVRLAPIYKRGLYTPLCPNKLSPSKWAYLVSYLIFVGAQVYEFLAPPPPQWYQHRDLNWILSVTGRAVGKTCVISEKPIANEVALRAALRFILCTGGGDCCQAWRQAGNSWMSMNLHHLCTCALW